MFYSCYKTANFNSLAKHVATTYAEGASYSRECKTQAIQSPKLKILMFEFEFKLNKSKSDKKLLPRTIYVSELTYVFEIFKNIFNN